MENALTSEELDQLNNYLQKSQKHLGYLTVEDRQTVLNSMREFLLSEVRDNRSIMSVLHSYKDQLVVINLALAKNGMPPLNTANRRWWKILLMAFVSFILLGVLIAIFTIKSYFPLVNVNDIDGTLELFGKHLILEKDDTDFFQKINDKTFMQWKAQAQIAKGTFGFGGIQLPLLVKAKEGELAIRASHSADMNYTCYTEQMVGELFQQNANHFIMNLENKAFCLLLVPQHLELQIELDRGVVNIKNIQQNFSVRVKSGVVSWRQSDQQNFYLQEMTAPTVNGPTKQFSKNGQWTVKIVVDEGEVHLR